MTKATPVRGRPVTIDRPVISAEAVAIFDRRGYPATSMDDVAEALGVSRRSLFRHFPVKASLVWFGFDPFVERFAANLRAGSRAEPVLAVIERAMLDAVTADTDLGPTRIRLSLIHRHVELRSFNSDGLSQVRDLVRGCVERRFDLGVESLESVVLADAVTAGMFAALQHWAATEAEETPATALRRAGYALTRLLPS